MISGYVLADDGSVQHLGSLDELAEAWQSKPKCLWADVAATDTAVLDRLGELFDLDAEALEDCRIGEQRPRTDDFDEHLFVLVYGILGPEDPPRFSPRKLGIFFGDRFILTVHALSFRTLTRIHKRLERKPAATLRRGADFLLYSILDGLVDNYLVCTEAVEDQLDELDRQSLTMDADVSLLAQLSEQRETVLDMRRMIAAQRELVAAFAHGEYDEISDRLQGRFQHVRDHLTQAYELIEAQREIVHGIRDNYFAVLSERTNRFMRTLTLFATFMLPLTFIAGLYGMNVWLWPDTSSPYTTLFVLGIMAAVVAMMIIYFRRKKLF